MFIMTLLACSIDKNKELNREKFTFKTGDDTELFFKNVRQLYYDLDENKMAKLNLFRLKKRVRESDNALINLAIVINYINDEASILIEPNEYLGNEPLSITWQNKSKTNTGSIKLENFTRKEMLEFASSIYEGIELGYTFKLAGRDDLFCKT